MSIVTTSPGPCTLSLTAEGARRLTARIRDALALADDLLVQAYEARAWEALGYESFVAYCAAELPELRMLKMRAPARKARGEKLRQAGATLPEIVAATGSSLGSVHRDLNPPAFQMETAEAADDEPVMSSVERAVVHVRLQGSKGLTCLELEDETGWRHGAASAALCRAEKRGMVRRVPTFRRGYAAYVAC